MKAIVWVLSVIGLLVCGCLGPISPAKADYITNTQDAVCTQSFAEWRNYTHDSEDPDLAMHQLSEPQGTTTQILSCKVGAHYVRVNYLMEPEGPGDCEAAEQGYVSAWVDGVRIVNRESFVNGRDTCGHAIDPPVPLITKIIVNSRMHLTVCHNVDTDNPRGEVCDVKSLVLDLSKSDPVYVGPLTRTPPALDLILKSDDICRSIDIEKYLENPLVSPIDDETSGTAQTYVIDIDNDGIPDSVTRKVWSVSFHLTSDWSWKSGRSGQIYSITDKIKSKEVDKDVGILTINGNNYVEQINALGDWCYLEGKCADLSGEDRILYRVSSDGEIHELCVWRARRRPEERL